MTSLHVLPGDSLLAPFRATSIEGEVAVFRECLSDGPVEADSLEELFRKRADFLSEGDERQAKFYAEKVRPEIEKVIDAPPDSEISLWFEHELFCQVNLWFLISKIKKVEELFVVSPPGAPEEQRFAGWSILSTAELRECHVQRTRIGAEDRQLASSLWNAFASRDGDGLRELSGHKSEAFKFLPEVATAASTIDFRPAEIVRGIKGECNGNFKRGFQLFREREPVYGFGDLQVLRLWK